MPIELENPEPGDLLRWKRTDRRWIVFDSEPKRRNDICVGHTALITKIECSYGYAADFVLYHPQYGQTSRRWGFSISDCWELVREEDLT